MNWRIRTLAATASTNDDAKQAAEAGEAEGLVIHAPEQKAGRGRQGRQWESPKGNLYCSILLRPPGELRTYGQYSFVAALALYDTVKGLLPDTNIFLKWPNDVLVNGKKISGILLEAGSDWLVIGMGLNVLHYPVNALYPCTSIRDCLKQDSGVELNSILKSLLGHLRYWYEIMRKDGFEPIRATWLERAQKGPMTVKLLDQTIEGTFGDIDEQGHLHLRLPNGMERVVATGDVFF
jgi:BirA family biotin operon repressor/biotin-[acetyl-CoA-carboxylase] ligase